MDVYLDPHVRVAGRPDDVKLAREKIMQLLDTRVSFMKTCNLHSRTSFRPPKYLPNTSVLIEPFDCLF